MQHLEFAVMMELVEEYGPFLTFLGLLFWMILRGRLKFEYPLPKSEKNEDSHLLS